MVRLNGKYSYCVLFSINFKAYIKPDNKYGYAYGHIHYANGNKSNGSIPCAGTYAWRIIIVLEEEMEVTYLKDSNK